MKEKKKHFNHINKWVKKNYSSPMKEERNFPYNRRARMSSSLSSVRGKMICSLVDSRWYSKASCVSPYKKCIHIAYRKKREREREKLFLIVVVVFRLLASKRRKWKEQKKNSIKNVIMTVIAKNKLSSFLLIFVVIVKWNESFLSSFFVQFIYSVSRINWKLKLQNLFF